MPARKCERGKMKIQEMSLHNYEILLTNGQTRSGVLVKIVDEQGNVAHGDVAPLPKWSHETLKESLKQLNQKKIGTHCH